jgi:predicted ribosome quality control (RQC) complex YloA/Tae2 family protein
MSDKDNQIDVLRNRIEKLEQEKTRLFNENEELREVAAKLQTNQGFVKASDVSTQDQDGEAKITDTQLIRNFVMDALKLKPREIVIKYRGSIVLEIKPIV